MKSEGVLANKCTLDLFGNIWAHMWPLTPSGPGVQDAARGPSPAADGGSGPPTPLGDAQRPAAQIHPQQTGRAEPRQGDTDWRSQICESDSSGHYNAGCHGNGTICICVLLTGSQFTPDTDQELISWWKRSTWAWSVWIICAADFCHKQ